MTGRRRQPTMLVINQVYVPDPVRMGQHLHDAALEMVQRGYRVVVLTSDRGYDDPGLKFRARERLDGVEVRRLPFSSFGKQSITIRLIAQSLFLLQAFIRGLFIRDLTVILVSTSPSMTSVVGAWISTLRGAPLKYWVMDVNPDQMIALRMIDSSAVSARIFDWINRIALNCASDVITLDDFMASRLNAKVECATKMTVVPPWPHEYQRQHVEHAVNPFRARHHLGHAGDKFVVMYSGNHGPSNPLATIIDAAKRLQDRDDIVFMFVGGGVEKRAVEEAIAQGYDNVVSLPYQPEKELRYSLSAADVHVVSVGDEVVGICHPCKVYGAMAVGRPVLLVGPRPSHASAIMDGKDIGWQVEHGDVDGTVALIETMAARPEGQLRAMGARAQQVIEEEFNPTMLISQFCDVVERGLPRSVEVALKKR